MVEVEREGSVEPCGDAAARAGVAQQALGYEAFFEAGQVVIPAVFHEDL